MEMNLLQLNYHKATVSLGCDAAKRRQLQSYRNIFNIDSQIQVSPYKALVRYQATQLASHIQCNMQVMAFKVTEGDENLF